MDPDSYVNELQQAKRDLHDASMAFCDAHGRHAAVLVDRFLRPYLDPKRETSQSLTDLVRLVINEIERLPGEHAFLLSQILVLSHQLDHAISRLGLLAIKQTVDAFIEPYTGESSIPLAVLRHAVRNADNALVAAEQGRQHMLQTGSKLITSAIRTIASAASFLRLRTQHLSASSASILGRAIGVKQRAAEQARQEVDDQAEQLTIEAINQVISVLSDVVLAELPTGTIVRFYKRLREIFVGKELDHKKSQVENVHVLWDLFKIEKAVLETFEASLAATIELINDAQGSVAGASS